MIPAPSILEEPGYVVCECGCACALDVDRLGRALVKVSEYMSPPGHGREPRLMRRHVPFTAEDLAREYGKVSPKGV